MPRGSFSSLTRYAACEFDLSTEISNRIRAPRGVPQIAASLLAARHAASFRTERLKIKNSRKIAKFQKP
jgi:hypothetical protein